MQARAFAEYLMTLMEYLDSPLPIWVNEFSVCGVALSPLSVAYLVGCTAINTLGSESAAAFSHAVTGLKLFILVVIVIVSIAVFEPTYFEPFLDEDKGFHGVIEATTILYFGYLGFDFVTTMAEEAIDAKRNVPKAILLSVIFCTIIYAVTSFSVQGVGHLNSSTGDGETALA